MFGTKNVHTAPLSQKAILDRVSEYDLWTHYLGHCTINKAFNSPLRKDKRPSAVLYVATNGKILLKDFGTGQSYDVFKFLQELKNYSYSEALLTIDGDFSLGMGYKKVITKKKPKITNIVPEYEKNLCHIMIKRGVWKPEHVAYWKEYHITMETLKKFKVHSLECYWVIKNNKAEMYEARKNPIFCYDFGDQKYKIYKPLDHNFRFMTNADNDILQGHDQLAKTGQLLIITKSLKDVMVLDQLGYNAVAVQSENSLPKDLVVNDLKSRFERIIVLFDNDIPGIQGAMKFCKLHDLEGVTIPKESKAKDIAEFTKLHGITEAKHLLKCLTEIEQQATIGKEK